MHPTVTPEALQEMYAHARRDYPRECCGLVYGVREAATAGRAVACVNIQDQLHAEDPARHPRTAATAYNLDAPDLFKLQKSLRGPEPVKIVYHSHVDVGAYFSDTDQAVAQMDGEPTFPVEYVVIDVRADGVRGAAQFAWDSTQKRYVEVARY
jgi:adenylyltransferase/sulfurtransferase